jgi:pimeloyl-ACP methyl ester carboxylesterase
LKISNDIFRQQHVEVSGTRLNVVEAGDPTARPLLFLHGFPESWHEWRPMMALAASQGFRAVALDLPGVGGSSPGSPSEGFSGAKEDIAEVVNGLVRHLGLSDLTLIGHDIGGMVAYAYLRSYSDLARAVIMDIVLPGVSPWEDFIRAPVLWHFAFHSIPELPEHLVRGKQLEYFEYFYNALSAKPESITVEARAIYAGAYRTDASLSAAFDWFRAFPADAEHNLRAADGPATATPLLYLRGAKERGIGIEPYVQGLRGAGVSTVEQAIVPGAGHFTPEEAPDETWKLIRSFLES